jgi:hypothetical protein
MDPIMEQVIAIIEARGAVTPNEIKAYLYAQDDPDALDPYQQWIAPGIDAMEDAVNAARIARMGVPQ